MIRRVGAALPYNCEQVFDMAADIERYPEFLEWWIAAHVRGREDNVCHVEQEIGLGPVRLKFQSTAVLNRPRRIDVTSADAAFRKYELSWLIDATAPVGCQISVTADIELAARLLNPVVSRMLPVAVDDIITAFNARAHHLYG
jgi:coenzyme Q-binding protein COQ10